MTDEQVFGELVSTAYGELAQLIDALAKASKEHDRMITVTLMISDIGTDESDEDESE
jgi:hypothetical protein